MGQFFPDFAQSARLGFQSGREMAEGQNPLGNFIRMMLADAQNRRAVAGEYEMKRGLINEEAGVYAEKERFKQGLEVESPQGKYYSALTESMRTNPLITGGGADTAPGTNTNPLLQFMKDPSLSEEDYIQRPEKVSMRGMPHIINVPKPKDNLSEEEERAIRDTANTLTNFSRLAELSPKVRTGFVEGRKFDPVFPMNRLLMGVNPKKEDIEFKSTLTDLKSNYVKAQSGVARGFNEFKFLNVAMPEPTYPNDVPGEGFDASVSEGRRRMELNLRNALMAADRRGKRLGADNRGTLSVLLQRYPLEQNPFGIKGSAIKGLPKSGDDMERLSDDELRKIALGG